MANRGEGELASLERREELSQVEQRRLEALAREKAQEWRSLLRRHTPQARQTLAKMLRDYRPGSEQLMGYVALPER